MAINGQWGTEKFTGNSAPNWFKDTTVGGGAGTYPANNVIYARPNHPADNHNLELTDRGWEKVIRYSDSAGVARTKREVVIAVGGLANTIAYGSNTASANVSSAGPSIVDIYWSTGNNAIGLISGGAGGDGILYPEASATVGVTVVFSEPVFVLNSIHNTANYAAVNVAAASTVGAGADTFIDCRTISGNGTNALTFSNGAISLASADTFSIADSATFITLNGTATISAATTYSGRGANTDSLTSQKRPANLSSFGVGTTGANTDVMQAVAGQTLAADAGARLSADA